MKTTPSHFKKVIGISERFSFNALVPAIGKPNTAPPPFDLIRAHSYKKSEILPTTAHASAEKSGHFC
jgi:hypothetical protein